MQKKKKIIIKKPTNFKSSQRSVITTKLDLILQRFCVKDGQTFQSILKGRFDCKDPSFEISVTMLCAASFSNPPPPQRSLALFFDRLRKMERIKVWWRKSCWTATTSEWIINRYCTVPRCQPGCLSLSTTQCFLEKKQTEYIFAYTISPWNHLPWIVWNSLSVSCKCKNTLKGKRNK